MALVLADRVRDTTTTTGTGTVTLSGTAPTGYQTFGAAIGNGNTTYYTINAGSQWEVGLGTYSSTGPTLARTTVLASSNGGSLVDFSTGTKDVFVTYPAEKSVNQDASGNVGIGTSSPGSKLDVRGVITGGDGTIQTVISYLAAAGVTGTLSNHPYVFYANNAERARIDTSGNFGIGVAPSGTYGKLTVAGGVRTTDDTNSKLELGRYSAGAPNSYIKLGTNSSSLRFTNAGDTADLMSLTNTGDLIVGGTSVPSLIGGGYRQLVVGGSVGGAVDIGTTSTSYGRVSGDSSGLNVEALGATFTAFRTNGSERMRITSAGGLAVGTTTDPGAGNIGLAAGKFLQYSSTAYMTPEDNVAGARIVTPGAFNLATGGTAVRMTVDASGNVGIGTSSPSVKFQVAGTSRVSQSGAVRYRADRYVESGSVYLNGYDDTGAAYIPVSFNFSTYTFNSGASERMRIDSSGNMLLGTTTAKNRLTVTAGANTNSPTLGSAGGIAYFSNTDVSYGLNIGNSAGDGHVWLQAQRTDGTATAYNLTLNEAGGNVGIGNASPGYRLDVSAADTTSGLGYGMRLRANSSANGGSMQFTDSGVTAQWGIITANSSEFRLTADGRPLTFYTGGAERARIDSSGNLLVGTTTVYDVNYRLSLAPAGGTGVICTKAAGSTHVPMQYLNSSGTVVGYISCDNTTTTYVTSSDARLKANIADADDAASLIDAIQVRKFDWKAGGEHQRYGFVAQELIAVAPEAVSQQADPDGMMGVDYSKLVPMLVKEIQSLRARVAQLEGK